MLGYMYQYECITKFRIKYCIRRLKGSIQGGKISRRGKSQWQNCLGGKVQGWKCYTLVYEYCKWMDGWMGVCVVYEDGWWDGGRHTVNNRFFRSSSQHKADKCKQTLRRRIKVVRQLHFKFDSLENSSSVCFSLFLFFQRFKLVQRMISRRLQVSHISFYMLRKKLWSIYADFH